MGYEMESIDISKYYNSGTVMHLSSKGIQTFNKLCEDINKHSMSYVMIFSWKLGLDTGYLIDDPEPQNAL